MKHFYKSLLVILLLTFGEQKSYSATYYVDKNNVNASNLNEGTDEDFPWENMQKAASTINGGDTLIVKEGTYEGSFTFSGLEASREQKTLIKAYTNHTVIFSGPGYNGGRVKIENCSWLEFRDFEITNFNQGLHIYNSFNLIISNINVHHIGQEAFAIKYSSSNILLEDCQASNTHLWQYNGEGFYIGTGSAGPLDTTSFITVRNCVIHDVVDEAIEFKPATHHCIAEGNIIYNIETASYFGAIEVNESNLGEQVWGENPLHVVRNNILYNIDGTAIRAGNGCDIYNNVIYNIEESSYGIFANNNNDDTYLRNIYHNTVHLPASRAVYVQSGTTDIKNNIGPSIQYNIPTENNFFINTNSTFEDFHLAPGVAPINAGQDVGIDIDIEGISRPQGSGWDIGAYEYVESGITPPPVNPPTNYPNPFNQTTTINYSVTNAGNVKLIIYDLLGREIKALVDEYQSEGHQTAEWDGTDNDGNIVKSGVYFCHISTKSGVSDSKEMIFLK